MYILPSVDLLIKGARIIYDVLLSIEVDHEAIRNLLTLLAEAMSDIANLIEITEEFSAVEELRDVLRGSMNRIRRVTWVVPH